MVGPACKNSFPAWSAYINILLTVTVTLSVLDRLLQFSRWEGTVTDMSIFKLMSYAVQGRRDELPVNIVVSGQVFKLPVAAAH